MENANNYFRKIELSCSQEETFKAIATRIGDWWSVINGRSDRVGGEFKISFGEESYWRFRVISLNEPYEIVWKCIDSHQDHNLKGIDEEWIGSMLYWKISKLESKTTIEFLHDGLISTGICYEVCSNGWDFYVLDSLTSFLETGKGKPSEK
ncbi:SRPBCC domain-containing protein [Maribacter sp. HTCC2170]|uniref:SRPBCC domain-containing protein n=1 Tax=Maribacter sp. (strain HTCC2170 / KCCM 42371) TaxID=313603 RepID=UPI00006B4986|nr:SRPBCC domain-containing protein [Maribacter sp. HTCC2170]EAR00952.1 hypothetical protein FB2170_09281 [Maribacter sp. HTCC2170]